MIKAFFVDFYGTLVHEDGEAVKKVIQVIRDTGAVECGTEPGAFWREVFQGMVLRSYGENFMTQRAIEKRSIERTLARFGSDADADELSGLMFAHWVRPPIFEGSGEFLEKSPVPVYIVSNIDTADIKKAAGCHSLKPAGIFTSEDARSYKPRKELFELALNETGLRPDEVVHIGDSLSSDVRGASALGIKALWLDRSGREIPDGVTRIEDLKEAFRYLA